MAKILTPMSKSDVPPLRKLGAGAFEAYSDPTPAVIVPSGLTALDKIILGALESDLILIAGTPGQGKTSLAMQWLVYAAQNGTPSAILSLEMKEAALRNRLIGQITGIDRETFLTKKWKKGEQKLAQEAGEWLNDLPLYIDDRSVVSADQAMRTMIEWGQQGIKLAVVDYIQQIRGTNESRTVQVGDSVQALKAGAKEGNLPVIGISANNRSQGQSDNRLPQLRDLRDTSELEYSADVVLMFHYPEEDYYEDKRIADIHVLKQRSGPVGIASTRFNRSATRFENLEGKR